jgi:hypothetical protein
MAQRILKKDDAYRFMGAYIDFLFFVCNKCNVFGRKLDFEEFFYKSPKDRMRCIMEFDKHPRLLDDFLFINRRMLPPERIQIYDGFSKRISGEFIILKYLQEHAIFLSMINPMFYAVKALTEDFSDVVRVKPPVLVRTILYPHNDRVIYDGNILVTRGSVDPDIAIRLEQEYEKALFEERVIMTLV